MTTMATIPLLMTAPAPAHPQTPGASVASARPGLQELFNTASQAEQDGDCAKALPLFDNLAQDARVKPGSLAAGAIAVRRGHCLMNAGRLDEGEASIEAGLPIMRNAGPNFLGDVAIAERMLGDVALYRNEHDTALAYYQALLASATGTDRLFPLQRLATVTAFDGGNQPLAYAEEALRIEMAVPKPDKKVLANIHDLHGRILMNQGQFKPAYAELKQALDLSGGLSYAKVSQADVALRGDVAQAALLNGDRGAARNYLSFTGEGRIAESPFASAVAMEAPECGTETGLKPEDVAIVDFSIADDGSVVGAQTVYSRGNYAVAKAFAQSVRNWFWRPEDIARLPPFYRTLTRVEMRCSTRGGDVPGVETPLRRRFLEWAEKYVSLPFAAAPRESSGLMQLRETADAAIKRGDAQTAGAALGTWAILNPRDGTAEVDAFDRAIVMGQQAAIPIEALNALRVMRLPRKLRADRLKSEHHRAYPSLSDTASFLPVADGADLADDALAADTLLLFALPPRPGRSERDAALALAKRVADDGRLSEHHPLRQAALLWLANQSAEAGNLAEAQSYFQRTGLNEQQCALIGVTPALRNSGASSNDYPREALSMGFEGWVRLEFDINANGTTARARPLIAYPPFIFADAATGMAKDMRYQTSYRPAGGEACSAQNQVIRFIIPTNH